MPEAIMSEDSTTSGDDFELVTEDKPGRKTRQPSRRHDVAAEISATQRQEPREASVRHDSPEDFAVDGFRNPFDVRVAPGWTAFWVTADDRDEFFDRPWKPALHGIDHVKLNFGTSRAKKGEEIVWKGLTLFLMRTSDRDALTASDPNRRRHRGLMGMLKERAEMGAGVDVDQSGNTTRLEARGYIKQSTVAVPDATFATE